MGELMVFKVYYEVRDSTGRLRFESVYKVDAMRFQARLESSGIAAFVGSIRRNSA
jgi:hypothetical protein